MHEGGNAYVHCTNDKVYTENDEQTKVIGSTHVMVKSGFWTENGICGNLTWRSSFSTKFCTMNLGK